MRMRTRSSLALPRSFHEYHSDAVASQDEVKNMYFEKRAKSLPGDQLQHGHRAQTTSAWAYSVHVRCLRWHAHEPAHGSHSVRRLDARRCTIMLLEIHYIAIGDSGGDYALWRFSGDISGMPELSSTSDARGCGE